MTVSELVNCFSHSCVVAVSGNTSATYTICTVLLSSDRAISEIKNGIIPSIKFLFLGEVIHLEIRKASKQDIADIAKVYVDGWRTTYRGLVPNQYLDELSYEEAEKRWNQFLDNENDPFMYVALNGEGKIVGFASGRSIEEKHFTGELYALYLLQDCRGLGVGRQLVSAVARHFKENGIHSMLVWVMEQNKSGLGFYKRMGGKEYIRRTSTFGETVVDDVAYGWNDISVLYDEELNKTN